MRTPTPASMRLPTSSSRSRTTPVARSAFSTICARLTAPTATSRPTTPAAPRRSVRILNVMTIEEADRVGIAANERTRHFRVDDGKANMARPPELAVWRRLESVDLGNGGFGLDGDTVKVAVPWKLRELPVRAALRRGVRCAENSAYGQPYAQCLWAA